MAGPHPVVGLAAELADGAGRSTHEAHVAVHLEDVEEILVAVVECGHLGSQTLAGGCSSVDQRPGIGGDYAVPGLFAHSGVIPCQHLVGDVVHPHQIADCQAGAGEFLTAVHRPEAVGEVVVLHRAVPLDVAVAAVVVGDEQSLVGNHLAGAARAEQHDCVLEG